MVNKIIVFDFDKTLTYNDTLLGFYICASRKTLLFYIKLCFYFILMIFAKLNWISNNKLKALGIFIFLKNKSKTEIDEIATTYANKLKFNKLFNDYSFDKYQNIYIVSASFEVYLSKLFPDNVKIIGSKIQYKNDLVHSLKFNCYKKSKVEALANDGVHKISVFYTDSYSDYPLANISEKTVIVKGDKLHHCLNINDFKMFFSKK